MLVQAASIRRSLDATSSDHRVVHSVFARAANLEMRDEMWTLLVAPHSDSLLGFGCP
jgi:hypothetical protein